MKTKLTLLFAVLTATFASAPAMNRSNVVALANGPNFNPNDLAYADPSNLGNPALHDAYEPGSTSTTRIPSARVSMRSDSLQPSRANFDAA